MPERAIGQLTSGKRQPFEGSLLLVTPSVVCGHKTWLTHVCIEVLDSKSHAKRTQKSLLSDMKEATQNCRTALVTSWPRFVQICSVDVFWLLATVKQLRHGPVCNIVANIKGPTSCVTASSLTRRGHPVKSINTQRHRVHSLQSNVDPRAKKVCLTNLGYSCPHHKISLVAVVKMRSFGFV